MEENGLIYFLLLLIVSICRVACSCDMQIPNGDVMWCSTDGEPCVYSCHKGYKKHDTVSWLKCSTSGEWVSLFSHWLESANDLCTPKPCPTIISKGAFSAECKAVVGSTCSFSCEAGYMRNTSASELTCQTSTEWSSDLRSLCLRPDGQQCSYYIPRGDLNLTCIREPGQTCGFTCDEGYQPSISPPTIACGSNLEWNHNTESLCQEIICPKLFEGGYVAETCSRKYKAMCFEYQCNPGYVKLAREWYIQCDETGKWIDYNGKSSACVNMSNISSSTTFRTTSPAATTRTTSVFPKLLCNMQIPHGEIAWWCASKGPPCPYSCHEGYQQHETVSWLNCSKSGQWFPQYPYQFVGVKFSVEDLCTRTSMSYINVSRSTGERSGDRNIGSAVGIAVGTLTGIVIFAFFVGWIVKRSRVRKSQRRAPDSMGGNGSRPTDDHVRNVTTIRQHPNADGMGSVSSFESPSYNGLLVHSFVQRIPSISSSCKYPGPPPSYSKTPSAPIESPPTYEEVASDPSRFNLYI